METTAIEIIFLKHDWHKNGENCKQEYVRAAGFV